MTCYHRIDAYKAILERTPRGKAVVTFGRPPRGPYEKVKLPCGQCIGCRLDKSRDWALRCVHEASLHERNCFLTLTYDDAHMPEGETLVKEDHQKFIKRLREHYRSSNPNIRYFLCGEYGNKGNRPHYHALIFNHDFSDKVFWCNSKGNKVYRSPTLEKLWPYGYSWIGNVTWQSAAYVARYVIKKVNGAMAFDRYVSDVDVDTGEVTLQEPEYIAMSRGGKGGRGIAYEWYQKFRGDCGKDYLTEGGKIYRVPRYYDDLLEVEDVEELNRRRARRKEYAKQQPQLDSLRLRQMEKHKEAAVKRLVRSL